LLKDVLRFVNVCVLLHARNTNPYYGHIHALKGVSIKVGNENFVSTIGVNAADLAHRAGAARILVLKYCADNSPDHVGIPDKSRSLTGA